MTNAAKILRLTRSSADRRIHVGEQSIEANDQRVEANPQHLPFVGGSDGGSTSREFDRISRVMRHEP